MPFNVNEIRSQLVYGGWKPSHFEVVITNPFDTSADSKIPVMVRAASIPTWNIGKVPVYYMGRSINVPGDRTFEEWQTTVYNDEDFVIRNSLELWSNRMNSLQGNLATAGPEINRYKATASIRAYGKDGRLLREYQMNGMFPLTVQSIETDWQATDQIAEFQVVWAYDEFELIGGITGDSGGK